MTFLADNWLPLLCLLAALGLGAAAVWHWHRHAAWPWQCYLPAAILSSFGIGAFDFLPFWLGPTLAIAAFCIFAGLLVVVILTGFWSAALGYALTCVFFFGLGDIIGAGVGEVLSITFLFLISLRPQEPWWLLLLLAVPLIFWTSYRNLIALGPTRRWIVLGLRCSLVVLLAFALAEAYARKPNDAVTVIFIWDRSLSIPPEFDQGRDMREERIFNFINQSVSQRGAKHADDRVGVIVFGKQARLELPPHKVPRLNFKKVLSQVDNSYTDIAGAMKLALASFPEGAGKRIVLISDGNENMGRLEEQARIAKQNGVQIDIVPIAAGRKNQNEILVERVEAPSSTEKGARLPLRVVIRSFHPEVVVAQLNLRKITFDPFHEDDKDRLQNSTIVKLRQGLNVYLFQQEGSKDETAFAYEATVVPLRVETEAGALKHRELPGDRIDNNEARATIMSRGQRQVLILEDRGDDPKMQFLVKHHLLVKRLEAAKAGLKVRAMTPAQVRSLTKGNNELFATFLSRFDAVFLANVPADSITEEEQKIIRSHVHDQGAGLVMIGGHQSFGAGGWQNTEIEKALPVNMELKSMKIEGKSGLVLIMHASEMAEGNAWQRKIAKLAIEKLSRTDMLGLLHYDHGFNGGMPGHQWHISFQPIGDDRKRLLKMLDTLQPGDMPDVDPAFAKAHKELTIPEYQLGTKHIILISDGDHWDASPAMINKLRGSKITCTTVCITSHGKTEVDKMRAVAQRTGGRAYHIKDPKELPAIYIRETRLISQSFIHEDQKGFGSTVMSQEGPTERMAARPPKLYGFVRTTLKDSSLVKELIQTDRIGEYKFPLLAAWQYGLGKSVAFTSDARTTPEEVKAYWDKDWANSDIYAKFWEQTVDWVLRPTESGKHLFLTTEHKDGKIRVIVEAQEEDKSPLTEIELKAGITSPGLKVKDDRKFELKFEQKNAGVYEAEIPADEVGAYFINIQAKWKKDGKEMTDNVRAGVTIPYSPEFAEMDSNTGLLEKIRDLTGGKAYPDVAAELENAARSADVFRAPPQSHASLHALWPMLVFLTAVCLLLDVAIRRIAIHPEALWAKSAALWHKLRGRASAEDKLPEYIERLKSRKAQIGETMDKQKAAVKFEAAQTSAAAPTVMPVAQAEQPKKPAPKPKKQETEEDYATRLMRAKKKAMEERDKDKPK